LFKENDDETMMIDDYALIAAKKNSINQQTLAATTKKNSTSNNRNYFQLTSSQLKSGLTIDTSYLMSSQTKEQKDLTFYQIYLAFNKPNQIKFEYDWISSSKQSMMLNSSLSCSETIYPSSSSSLIYNQNQRQRFYIDTLASVAASFLRDLQNNTTNTNTPTATNSAGNLTNIVNKNIPNVPSNLNSNQQNKSSPPKSTNTNIALIQPPSSSTDQDNTITPSTTTTHILPLDTVLQRLNEEQANKTRKLLSDLNSTKRRTRYRKQIMVVNTSNSSASSTRNVLLPKLNFLSHNDITDNNNPQQQNIVLSGPVAAVARQIVNTNTNNSTFTNILSSSNNSTLNTVSTNTTSSYVSANKSQIIEQNNNSFNNNINRIADNNDQYIILSNYNHHQNQLPESFDTNTNYSNLMPQFFASLTTIATENSSSSSSNNNTDNNLNNQIEPAAIMNNNEIIGSPQTLADMSLLDMSINNTDSLFGTSSIQTTNGKLKQDQETTNCTLNEGAGAFSGLKLDKNNSSNNNLCGNFSHKRSDIIVEWTDSVIIFLIFNLS